MAFTGSVSNKPEDVLAAATTLLTRLEVANLAEQKLKSALKKGDAEWDAGGIKANVTEVKKGAWPQTKELTAAGKPGAALIVFLELSPTQVVVGLGFQDATSAGDPGAVKAAIESVRITQ